MPGSRDEDVQGEGPRSFPRILKPGRNAILSRLLVNGLFQAAVAVALPFAIMASAQLPVWEGAALLGLLGGALIALRVLELSDAERLGLDYVAEVRLALFDGLAAGTAKASHGVAMSRMLNDLSALKNWVGLGVARSAAAGLAFAGCVLSAASMSPLHALVILIPALLIALIAFLLAGHLLRRVGEVRRVRGKLAGLLGEALLSIDMLRSLDQTGRSRRRVSVASRSLAAALGRRMRIAATLRALPEAVLPCSVVGAVALGLPLTSESIGLMLLAGLAVGPMRQALRALEYRAAFKVARERLASGLGRRMAARKASASMPCGAAPRLEVVTGPLEQAWHEIVERGLPVTAETPVLARSLRRNIDIAGNFRGDDDGLARIAERCGLLDRDFAPKGLDSRLSPNAPGLTESRLARLSLARALAHGERRLAINAPVLLIEPDGRALLRDLPEAFGVYAYVVVGDCQLLEETEADRVTHATNTLEAA